MGKKISVLKYIDPCSDWGFKRIFGTDANKDLLIAFINALFQGHKQIDNILNDECYGYLFLTRDR